MRHATLALILAAAALSGCNAPRQTQPVVDPMVPQRPAGAAELPSGSGCSGAVARYRAVMENDLAMGHVNRGVYDQIQGEINEAASACSSGQDARAVLLVRSSKARHGYPG